MQNSQAPVYVVLKSFAASITTLIVTLAKKSYAYPNAMIVHKQPWQNCCGSLRELQENLEHAQKWWGRFGGQLAQKVGIILEKLDKALYEKSANGVWREYADHAQKIKWVDYIITDIHDTSIRETPDPADYTLKKGILDLLRNERTCLYP